MAYRSKHPLSRAAKRSEVSGRIATPTAYFALCAARQGEAYG